MYRGNIPQNKKIIIPVSDFLLCSLFVGGMKRELTFIEFLPGLPYLLRHVCKLFTILFAEHCYLLSRKREIRTTDPQGGHNHPKD